MISSELGFQAYTFWCGPYASRLDLILLSTHLSDGASHIALKVSTQSDHSLFLLQVHKTTQVKGPGMWKFNPALLENETFIKVMTDFLAQWNAPPELSTPCSVWEWLKYKIKTATIKFFKENVLLEKQIFKDLSKSLQSLTRRADMGEDVSDQIASMRRELGEMEEIRTNKLISRARTRWTMLGEKRSAYYLNLEKRKSRNKALSTILLEDGSTISEPQRILEECSAFYQKLYWESAESLTPLADFPRSGAPGSSEAFRTGVQLPRSPITREDLKKALSQLNKNKSPGMDGLGPEFYLKFWELVSPYLFNNQNWDTLDRAEKGGGIYLGSKEGRRPAPCCQLAPYRVTEH